MTDDNWQAWMSEADEKSRIEYAESLGGLKVALRAFERGMTAEEVAVVCNYDVEAFKNILAKKGVAVEELPVELIENLSRGRTK